MKKFAFIDNEIVKSIVVSESMEALLAVPGCIGGIELEEGSFVSTGWLYNEETKIFTKLEEPTND